MKRILLTILFLSFFIFASDINAQSACGLFSLSPQTITAGQNFNVIKSNGLINGEFVRATIVQTGTTAAIDCFNEPTLCDNNPTQILTLPTDGLQPNQTYTVKLDFTLTSGGPGTCNYNLVVVGNQNNFCANPGLTLVSPTIGQETTRFIFTGCMGAGTNPSNPCNGESRLVVINTTAPSQPLEIPIVGSGLGNSCNPNGTFTQTVQSLGVGVYTAQLYIGLGGNASPVGQIVNITVETSNTPGEGDDCTVASACTLCSGTIVTEGARRFCSYENSNCIPCSQCTQASCSPADRQKCQISCNNSAYVCVDSESGGSGISTALGCFPITNQNIFIGTILSRGAMIAGGIAFLLFIWGALQVIMSRGDAGKVQAGKELITASLAGIIFLIFSVFIYQFIATNILQIL